MAYMIQTVKLTDHPETLNINWPSSFDASKAHIHLHRTSSHVPPTGYLSAPIQLDEEITKITLKITRDNNEIPDEYTYLGSYSDSYMGPTFHALHVYLVP